MQAVVVRKKQSQKRMVTTLAWQFYRKHREVEKSRGIYFLHSALGEPQPQYQCQDRNLGNQFEMSGAVDRQTEYMRNMEGRGVILGGRERNFLTCVPTFV